MHRVARRRVLVRNADPALAESFGLTRDYLPGVVDLAPEPYRRREHWQQELGDLLGKIEALAVPVPHDCHDGFYQSYWRRPRAYLDPAIRAGTSIFHCLPKAEVDEAVERLRRDLDQGRP